MRKLILFIGIGFFISSLAFAQTPSEVLKPYKDYRAQLEAKDYKKAMSSAFTAWQKAEDLIGDAKITGDLAQNYGQLAVRYDGKKAEDALKRAVALSEFYAEEDQATVWLERSVNLASYRIQSGKYTIARRQLSKASDYADAAGMGRSTFAGEIKTLQARTYVVIGNHKKTEEYAEAALKIFENREDGIKTYQPVLATLYSGYGKEGQEDFVPAIMEYQEIMENLDGALPRDHPLLTKSLGRWMTMRERIVREGLLEEAEAAGLCECWPYDKNRNENVVLIKRVAPKMPREAYQSGFSIVEFDLKDDGSTDNIRILESWPEDVFEKSSRRAVAKWKYNPRTSEETDEDRKDIITTVRYVLTDQFGNHIE